MRRILTLFAAVLVISGVAAPTSAAEPAKPVGKFNMTTKITSVRAAGDGLVANGVVVGKLSAGGPVVRDGAPARRSARPSVLRARKRRGSLPAGRDRAHQPAAGRRADRHALQRSGARSDAPGHMSDPRPDPRAAASRPTWARRGPLRADQE